MYLYIRTQLEGMNNSILLSCHEEPIHRPQQIQNRGYFLGFDENLKITHISENFKDIINTDPSILIGKYIDKIQDFAEYPAFVELAKSLPNKDFTASENNYLILNFQQQRLYAIPLVIDNTFVIELEKEVNKNDISNTISTCISEILASYDVEEIMKIAVTTIKEVTDFDKVMVYKFLEDESGEVIAEAKNNKLESFMGQRYPESDIPKQARELYLKKHFRLLMDAQEKDIKILSKSTEMLDLTYSNLRAMSPVHSEYCTNMGIRSSYSVSIIQNEKLWGLLSCHSVTPKNIDYKTRLATKLIAEVMISSMVAKDGDNKMIKLQRLDNIIMQLHNQMLLNANTSFSLSKNINYLAELLNANVAIYGKDTLTFSDPKNSLPKKELESIKQWYFLNKSQQIYITNNFKSEYNFITDSAHLASGVVIFPLMNNNEIVLFYRPEKVYTVQWAGVPTKETVDDIIDNKNVKRFIPRKSFSVYRETISNTSEQWSEEEWKSVKKLMEIVNDINFRKNIQKEEYEKLLAKKSEELQSFSYTISHDLKTPLTVIRIYADLLSMMKFDNTEAIMDVAKNIKNNVGRIDGMIDGILSISKINKKKLASLPIDCNKVINEIIEEQKMTHDYANTAITVAPLPTVIGDAQLIYHVFSNIISNALKYSAKCDEPKIKVEGIAKQNQIIFKIIDNGIGISPSQHASMFELFKRSDNVNGYEGNGVGLAIVKSIMEKHNGYVWFISNVNEATAFYLVFNQQPHD